MKKTGTIITIAGAILFAAMTWDLFGNKNWPKEITVPGMILGIASVFFGPAFIVFAFSARKRKKIQLWSFIFSICLIIVGLISAKLQLPGARVEIVLGVLIVCFFYGVLAFKSKYEKWQQYARSKYDAVFLSLFDFIGIGALFLGFLFKIQHWPLSELMTTIGLITLAIGVLAWNQKFKNEVVFRKEAEDKLTESLKQIAAQHEKLEEKNKDITDSINYAKNIQQAILPLDHRIEEALKEHFILFKPRDIVSGDFYWFTEKDNFIFLAVADCTGHGVPGAFMSMIGSATLTHAVSERGITEPAKILSEVNQNIKKALKQTENNNRDGMDISLLRFEKNNINNIQFAGAMRTLYHLSAEFNEVKGDKMPIGGTTDDNYEYNNHKLSLQKGDMLYIFSDGYADQFGGNAGKKFRTGNFKKLLLSIHDKSMDEQKQVIDETFESWKGKLEQIDDVCIAGIRV